MELLLRISLPIMVAAIALVDVGLASKWRDRRTRKHRWALRGLVGLLVIACAGMVYLAGIDYWTAEEQAETLEKQTAAMDAQAEVMRSLEGHKAFKRYFFHRRLYAF